MSYLLGIEHCKVDTNGRFKLPIALKKQLGTEDNRFVVRRSIYADCLELWTYASFEEEVALLTKELNRYKKEDVELLRKLVRCNVIELDTNDRMLIPPEQKPLLKSAKEIVLQSVGKFIEIWDYDTYAKMDAEPTDFASLVDQRLGGLKGEVKEDC
ncbi:MAG: hypothetical protein IJ764_03835 [Bacteroidales bacterium]|nr:hypothetical protein [Bacteroidales bacterium]